MDSWQPKLLIQTIPEDLPGTLSRDDELDIITEDVGGISFVNKDLSDLPKFLYTRDSETGIMIRYLAVEKDTSFVTDPDYTNQQQWLLNQRQGDQYDRVKEWIPYPNLAVAESDNEQGFSLLNEGLIWGDVPNITILDPITNYEKYMEYSLDE